MCIDFRSNGQGAKGALGRRSGSPEPCSAAALHRSRLNSPFPGSNRPAPRAGVIYTPCVIHLGSKRRSGRLGAALAGAAAGLRGGAPRHALTCFWGSSLGTNKSMIGRSAKASAGKTCAGLCCVAGFPPQWTTAARRRSAGEWCRGT